MMRKIGVTFLCGLLASLLLVAQPGAMAKAGRHKFHVSVAQLEFNPAQQAAEVVLRVYADDLESALSRHAQRAVKIDPAKSKEVGAVAMAYLSGLFELKNKAGKPVKFTWVGVEAQADMYWLYFEGKAPGGLEGAQLRNRLLFELFDDQVNIVNVKLNGKQLGLMFEPKDEFKVIAASKPAR